MLYRDILGIFQCTKESNFSRFQKKMCFFEFFRDIFRVVFQSKITSFFMKKIERKSTFHTSSLIFYTKNYLHRKKSAIVFHHNHAHISYTLYIEI